MKNDFLFKQKKSVLLFFSLMSAVTLSASNITAYLGDKKIVNNLKGRSNRLLIRDIGVKKDFDTGHILQVVLVAFQLK